MQNLSSDGVKHTSLKARTQPSRPRPRTSKLSSRILEDEDFLSTEFKGNKYVSTKKPHYKRARENLGIYSI